MPSSIVCSGSIALDTTRTPFKTVENVLGGAASYFSLSARFFAPVNVIGVIGEDFPKHHWEMLSKENISLKGVERKSGKTFHYDCTYSHDLYHRHANKTELNVLADFEPKLTEEAKKSEFAYLATMPPQKQLSVLMQARGKKLAFMDTIEHYIKKENGFHETLKEVLAKVDGVVLNDMEARLLTEESNLVKCSRKIAAMGPRIVLIKKGEHGCLLFFKGKIMPFPAFPLETIVDPNGAGDAFAGGLIGYLASQSATSPDEPQLKTAIAYGTVMGSLVVEDFSVERLAKATHKEIDERFAQYKELTKI